jgi:hypothetical protein
VSFRFWTGHFAGRQNDASINAAASFDLDNVSPPLVKSSPADSGVPFSAITFRDFLIHSPPSEPWTQSGQVHRR